MVVKTFSEKDLEASTRPVSFDSTRLGAEKREVRTSQKSGSAAAGSRRKEWIGASGGSEVLGGWFGLFSKGAPSLLGGAKRVKGEGWAMGVGDAVLGNGRWWAIGCLVLNLKVFHVFFPSPRRLSMMQKRPEGGANTEQIPYV